MNNNSAQQTRKLKKSIFRKTIIVIVSIFLILGFVYVYANFPSLWQKLNYSPQKSEQAFAITTADNGKIDKNLYKLLFLDIVGNYPGPGPTQTEESPEPEPEAEETEEATNTGSSSSAPQQITSGNLNNTLFLPKLNIRVPVVWDSALDEATMLENLKRGVIHYLGTTKPGEDSADGQGNVFIAGHSSYYRWDSGKYKTVFANLEQMDVGDKIAIGYYDKVYVYQVFDKVVVLPEDVSVLNQATDKPTLSLMTCVPVGTNDKRVVIKSEFVGFAE